MVRWWHAANPDVSLDDRIAYLGNKINWRQWGWLTRRFAKHTVLLNPNAASAYVYAFMVCIKAGKVRQAEHYKADAYVYADPTPQQLSGMRRDMAIYHIEARCGECALREVTQAYTALGPNDDPNLYIVLDVQMARIVAIDNPHKAKGLYADTELAYAALGDRVNPQFVFNLRMLRLYNASLLGDRLLADTMAELLLSDTARCTWRHKMGVAVARRSWSARAAEQVLRLQAAWRRLWSR